MGERRSLIASACGSATPTARSPSLPPASGDPPRAAPRAPADDALRHRAAPRRPQPCPSIPRPAALPIRPAFFRSAGSVASGHPGGISSRLRSIPTPGLYSANVHPPAGPGNHRPCVAKQPRAKGVQPPGPPEPFRSRPALDCRPRAAVKPRPPLRNGVGPGRPAAKPAGPFRPHPAIARRPKAPGWAAVGSPP